MHPAPTVAAPRTAATFAVQLELGRFPVTSNIALLVSGLYVAHSATRASPTNGKVEGSGTDAVITLTSSTYGPVLQFILNVRKSADKVTQSDVLTPHPDNVPANSSSRKPLLGFPLE